MFNSCSDLCILYVHSSMEWNDQTKYNSHQPHSVPHSALYKIAMPKSLDKILGKMCYSAHKNNTNDYIDTYSAWIELILLTYPELENRNYSKSDFWTTFFQNDVQRFHTSKLDLADSLVWVSLVDDLSKQ